jgi:cysteine desulfurase
VVEAMLPYFGETYGNPLSAHQFGRKAEYAVEMSRESVARILNCQPSEVVFTSGGSESDNLALRGVAWYRRLAGNRSRIVTTPVEHSAVEKTVEQLEKVMGFEATILPVDAYGRVNVADLAVAADTQTAVASVIYANNEVGTINPVAELIEAAHRRGVLFHTDAVQAAGQLPLDVQVSGVDLLSLSGHKFYGPKGVGVLFIREGIELLPNHTGGGHEDGRRAGTHNVPLIVGLAKALELAYAEREHWVSHFNVLRAQLIDGVMSRVPGARLTGDPDNRLPSHASFLFDGLEGNTLVMHLDMRGVAASTASACKTGNPEPSDVLLAMGYTPDEAAGSLRLTVGRGTTPDDIDYTVDVLVDVVEKVRKLQREMRL